MATGALLVEILAETRHRLVQDMGLEMVLGTPDTDLGSNFAAQLVAGSMELVWHSHHQTLRRSHPQIRAGRIEAQAKILHPRIRNHNLHRTYLYSLC